MSRVVGVWRRNLRLWLPALLLCLVNLGAFTVHRLVYAGRAEARVERFDRSAATLARLEAERRDLQDYVERAVRSRDQIAEFFTGRLGTEEKRLTEIIAEIKMLARNAGLEPSTITYRWEPDPDHGVAKRFILFTVTGPYMDLRELINLLELSDSFITLERVALNESDAAGSLRISLQLASLFVLPEEAAAATAAGSAG